MASLGRLVIQYCRKLSYASPLFKGHSKWQNIKATKTKFDQQRSQQINVMLRRVKAAVKDGGGFDMKLNRKLAAVNQDYKAAGLPLDTLNNFLKKLKEKPEHTHFIYVVGPGGSFFVIETETDSIPRMNQTVAKYLNKMGGGFRIITDPSICGNFDEKGVLHISCSRKNKPVSLEEMEEVVIELECEDVALIESDSQPCFEVMCSISQLRQTERKLAELGYSVILAEMQMRAKHTISLSKSDSEKVEKLYEYLQEDSSIKQIFDNIEPEMIEDASLS
ncbi:hypothetical protein AB6A40_008808 [Gnathostoma spinigerum]|uniref:Uncharacterized protein n=1 Tax=Gnathostoma spinigerum TaxID=75299 RepID=A0ABD6EXV9_9BILA